ncbi:SAM-dependent methyltransferase [Mycobacterium colombiense]|uniref:S-adenosyl-L-methionine-dependent methyltransferase n=1 Tax=Mycobacterium colombiense TaxID=339268 RepID=A0A853LTE1_9MYCO|nr:SAM-dependent methyltransferase [Mycobacterium colombiense]OBJ13672.1 SAM-dependent methyltransferase [Mycobacterium colombiense]OBJ14627.1 SAM-dependent methyltransferase [Mycobacterium colombiense]OBJ32227.1 SAM-dependent methyltransferase [Mycobacterium colombiense]OBJ42114.1 SAM-dependent methyltransferase [Mycobacterium colombiense]OBJ57077.1 SAM-dependent methyltransferase [Mycobacterium colombiense]
MTRSAGDTWDIVTSVGFTALAVCAARALDAALRPPLANDAFAAGFVAAAGEPNLIAAVDNADMSSAAAFNAQWVGVRTRFFDEFFADAGRSGTRQAVILAAGLDSRAYRLEWPAGHAIFEVDQPRVLEFKQQVLDRQGAVPSTRRVTVATDLRDDWAGELIAAGFDPGQPTAWALEGLLPYLPGAAQDALFDKLHDLSAVGSHIAAELGPAPGEVQEFADNVPTISQDTGQPPVAELWYDDPRTDTKDFLAQRGWQVTGVDLVDKAAAEYGRPFQELPVVFDRLMRTKFFTAVRKG